MVQETKKRQESGLDIAAAKQVLLARKKELEVLMGQFVLDAGSGADVQDTADAVQAISRETLNISLQDAEVAEYNMIIKAIQMIEDGTYGQCVECSHPISEKRLKLYPNAMRCLVCQEMLEERRRE
jgi:DnaK suppressor protein